eukprot:4235427-Amphidinium_carterae.1
MVGNIAVLGGVRGGCKLNKCEGGTTVSVNGAGTGYGIGAGRTSDIWQTQTFLRRHCWSQTPSP